MRDSGETSGNLSGAQETNCLPEERMRSVKRTTFLRFSVMLMPVEITSILLSFSAGITASLSIVTMTQSSVAALQIASVSSTSKPVSSPPEVK